MKHSKAISLLNLWNATRPSMFARQSMDDVKEIELSSTEELTDELQDLIFTNYIYGCVSLNELQRIDLISMELDARHFSWEKFDAIIRKMDAEFNATIIPPINNEG